MGIKLLLWGLKVEADDCSHCLWNVSYTPQSDVYKVLRNLLLTNSVRLPIFFVSFQHPCTSAKSISAVALECGFERLEAVVRMPLDHGSGAVVQSRLLHF